MPISFEKIGQSLHYLSEVHGVPFCIKDFCGFVAINKQLDETLRPFLAHTNPFCMYMKSDQEHHHTCLTMIRRMYHKCERLGRTYFGMCHAGLGEYVVPIFDGDVLLGSINAGFFQTNESKTTRRICRACRQEPPLDPDTAQRLYHSAIRTPTANVEQMLAGLELLAEYLGQTYHLLHSAQPHSDAAGRYHDSSEDTILAHALEYIRINYKSRITVTALAEFCHCSDSYLSRIFNGAPALISTSTSTRYAWSSPKVRSVSPMRALRRSKPPSASETRIAFPASSRRSSASHPPSSASGSIRIMANACF